MRVAGRGPMLKKVRFTRLGSVLFSVAMLSLAFASSGQKDAASPQRAILRVELPPSERPFPPGIGADIANSQCLICHSAGMVLTQPPLKKDEWRAEIVKMRSAYGAPIPDDQVDDLSEYLKNISARQSQP
jgi:mono/diheme cytochrome c family protein